MVYLCTTPQGRNGRFERADNEKKEGLCYLDAEIEKVSKNKFSHLFWIYQKDLYLCSPNGNEGNQNKIDNGAMPTSYGRSEMRKRKKFFKNIIM